MAVASMKLKRFISACLKRMRSVFRRSHTPKRNYFRKPDQPCIPETLTECIDEIGVISIGDSYRRTHPEWNMGAAISTDPGKSAVGLSTSFRKRRQWLADEIRSDFADGHLTQVQGWILSQVEAEQCARLSTKPF